MENIINSIYSAISAFIPKVILFLTYVGLFVFVYYVYTTVRKSKRDIKKLEIMQEKVISKAESLSDVDLEDLLEQTYNDIEEQHGRQYLNQRMATNRDKDFKIDRRKATQTLESVVISEYNYNQLENEYFKRHGKYLFK